MKFVMVEPGVVLDDAKLGPPFNDRLAALDDELARAVVAGTFANDRDAAKRNLHRYTDRVFGADEWDARNDKIKRVTKRIRNRRLSLPSA